MLEMPPHLFDKMASMTSSTILVTGAGSGLGRGLSLRAARAGFSVAALDLHEVGLVSLAAELAKDQRPCRWATADVTDAPGLEAKIKDLESQVGPIDLVIASAGIGAETSALDFQASVMARVIGVNLIGVSNTFAAVLPGMLERHKGHLVAISSMASYRGLPRMLGYCASKSGVNALMEGMRLEVEPRGLQVTTICPGFVRTPMTAPFQKAIPEMLELEPAVEEIWWAIRRGKRFHAFPRSLVWQTRLFNCLPARWTDGMVRKMIGRIPGGGQREP